MEQLFQLDQQIFWLINVEWANVAFHTIMPFLRNKLLWGPLYLFLLSFIVINEPKRAYAIIAFALLCVFLTDQLTASVMKPYFDRLRPCQLTEWQDQINVLVRCGGGRSFPSAHAANHFGVAVFIGGLFAHRSKLPLFLLCIWAAAISYAQVYVGVNFPLDITVGAILGMLIGWLCISLLFRIYPKDA